MADWTPPADSKTVDVPNNKWTPPSDSVAVDLQEQSQEGSVSHNIGRTAVESAGPAAVGLAGFAAGTAASQPVAAGLAPLTGPFAPITYGAVSIAGGLGGAFVASGAAQKAQDWMHELFAPDDFKQRQIEKQQNPESTFYTQLGVNMLGQSWKAAPEVAGKLMSKPLVQRASSAAMQGGLEAGVEMAQTGEVDWKHVATAAGAGAAMPGINRLGKKVMAPGEKLGDVIADKVTRPASDAIFSKKHKTYDIPEAPPPGAPEEQKKAFFEKLDTLRKEMEADTSQRAELVATAIKNKETGEIEYMGPKHDEARKAETKDTHEQGFVDEKGKFLTRQEAYERAKNTGQLSEDHKLEFPEEGLHSGDLRAAGDIRFKLSETPDGLPHKMEGASNDRKTANRIPDAYFASVHSVLPQKDTLRVYQMIAAGEMHRVSPEDLLGYYGLTGKDPHEIQEYLWNTHSAMNSAAEKRMEIVQSKTLPPEEIKRKLAYIDDTVTNLQTATEKLQDYLESYTAQAKGDIPNNARYIHQGRIARAQAREFDLKAQIAGTTDPLQLKGLQARHALSKQNLETLLKHQMPDVVFADKQRPSPAELQSLVWGSKDVGQVLDKLITAGVGTKDFQELAKALSKNTFVREAGYSHRGGVEYVDTAAGRQPAGGYYIHGGPGYHDVVANVGTNLPVILHEIVHAGTARYVDSNPGSPWVKALDQIWRHLSAVQNWNSGQADRYGMTNVKELISEGFTHHKFQQDLQGVLETGASKAVYADNPSPYQRTLWDAFKEAVAGIHNLPKTGRSRSALDEVLELGTEIMRASEMYTKKPLLPAPNQSTSPKKEESLVSPSKFEGSEKASEVEKIPSPKDMSSESEMYKNALEIQSKHGDDAALEFYKGFLEYKKTWLEPIKETEKLIGWNINGKLANERAISNEKALIDSEVPDAKTRAEITMALDRGHIGHLTGKAREVAERYQQKMKDIGTRALEAGVVKGLLDNYVSHIIDWTGIPKDLKAELIRDFFGSKADPSMKGMDVTSRFAKERVFRTFADLQHFLNEANRRIAAAGKTNARLAIKTQDIGEIYKEYAMSMEAAINNKKLVDNLLQIRMEAPIKVKNETTGKYESEVIGDPMIKKVDADNPIPYGWEMISAPQFSGYAVHPDMAPHLKFVFDAGPGQIMHAIGAISQFVKRVNVVGSFFHAKSLLEVLSSSQIPVWTPLKEAILLPLVEKGIKATTGKELQLSAITKAVDQYRHGGVGDNVDRWIRESNLQLEVPEDVSRGILTNMGKVADSFIARYGPRTRVLEKSLSTVEKYTLGLFDKYTWDYLHTGGKLMVADAFLDKARRAALESGKPFDETTQRKEIASHLNNAFGGLNWYKVATEAHTEFGKKMALAAYSPAGRRGLQPLLFAPDWTISTIRAFTSALPNKLNPTKWHPVEGAKGLVNPTTKSDYARLYQFKTALTYLTVLNLLNQAVSGRNIWENKDKTRIEFGDGTSVQAMKHAMEPYHWLANPVQTLVNKLGFLPKAAIILGGNLEYASPQSPKLADPSLTNKVAAVAEQALPFQVSAAINAPEGEGVKRAVLGTAGFPVYGATKEVRKKQRAERSKILKQKSEEYRKQEREAGRTP